jgi:hypothetical protein
MYPQVQRRLVALNVTLQSGVPLNWLHVLAAASVSQLWTHDLVTQ